MTKTVLNACSNFYPYAFGGTEVYVEAYCTFLKEKDIEPIVICAVPEQAFEDHQTIYEDNFLIACKYLYQNITVLGLKLKHITTELIYAKYDEKLQQSYGQFIDTQAKLKDLSTLHIHSFTATIGQNLFSEIKAQNKEVKIITSYHTPISCPKNTLMLGNSLKECSITPNLRDCTNCIITTQTKIPILVAKTAQKFNLKHHKLPAILKQKHLVNLELNAFNQLKEITQEWWCYSEGIREILKINDIPNDKIKFVRHGISEIFFNQEIQKRIDKTIYLFSGRLTRIKGVTTLFKAWQSLPELPGRELWLTATDTAVDDEEISALVQKIKIRGDIKFLGNKTQHELATLYAQAHFVIIPSECFEIGPLVFHEAVLNECNVIASNIGGCEELAKFYKLEKNLFQAGNAKSLKEKIINSQYKTTESLKPTMSTNHFIELN